MPSRESGTRWRREMMALLIDTETTGLIENRSMPLDRQPEVIEFFGLRANLDSGKVRTTYQVLIRPSRPFQEQDTRSETGRKRRGTTSITGITNQMLERSPLFSKVADKIIDLVEGSGTVVAHNVTFDREVLDIEAERLGRRITWPPLICTVEQSTFYRGYRLSLGELHEHLFQEKFSGAHRAEADVRALLRCCVEMRRRGDL